MSTLLGEAGEAYRGRGAGEEPGIAKEARRGSPGGRGSKNPPHVDPNNLYPSSPSLSSSLSPVHTAWLWNKGLSSSTKS